MDDGGRTPTWIPSGASAQASGAGPLEGSWVLVAGYDAVAAARLRGRLAGAGCAAVELAADVDEAVERVAAARFDGILALPGIGDALRKRLDPLGLQAGPPVVAVEEIPALPAGEAGDDAVIDRLTVLLERHMLRGRVRELEGALATHAIADNRAADELRLDALRRLGHAAEYRDDNTFEHTQRVGGLAALLARAIGLSDRAVENIRLAAPLHDLGKIAIPDSILLKPDRLTEEEFEVIKTHAAVGAEILAGGESDLFRTAAEIAGGHHERWDGGGYPEGLAGDAIPIAGRLVAVADVFDILVHERPYKEEWKVEDAAAELRRASGSQFDPEVVEAFESLGASTWRALAADV